MGNILTTLIVTSLRNKTFPMTRTDFRRNGPLLIKLRKEGYIMLDYVFLGNLIGT